MFGLVFLNLIHSPRVWTSEHRESLLQSILSLFNDMHVRGFQDSGFNQGKAWQINKCMQVG